MEQVRLGTSGLEVSRIALGCMSYGEPGAGTHAWSMPEEESRASIRRALEAGVTFFDTANVYSAGTSEEFLGRALRDFASRDDVVIATKVNGRMRPGPNGAGLSRAAIMTEIDHSLRRLGVDHVDLYQIHRFDPHVPVEETMEALHDVVRAGKARYLGASSMWTWQLAEMQHAADRGGWTRFVSMQDHYNLLMREEEREMLPYCAATGVGTVPWSPLARGRLTRPFDQETARTDTDEFGKKLYRDDDGRIVDAVAEVARGRGVSPAQVALAWVLRNPVVSAPIVGTTKPHHLDDAVAATTLELDDDEVARLEEHYTPRENAGFA
ncbi:aldo/keto reductase [Pseudokineococcus lusitanus]|uniref:Aryl-alcohol dehydrogenase-like predicted oxidoreductase n=1 Tax=Pseudokineococcus lusitanus TaxID=763993 RepID=A0A3N1HQ62_9ACTN|nr:aldo/keto reductase [Pseudokineococcus lusitanus]ROP44647.1 aryl-alcohol dehydrogenase-like predicted oxidoreductase [Pseudokineococcus lusitanus]